MHAGGLGSTHAPMAQKREAKRGIFMANFPKSCQKGHFWLVLSFIERMLFDALKDAIEAGLFLLPLCADDPHTSASRVKPPS